MGNPNELAFCHTSIVCLFSHSFVREQFAQEECSQFWHRCKPFFKREMHFKRMRSDTYNNLIRNWWSINTMHNIGVLFTHTLYVKIGNNQTKRSTHGRLAEQPSKRTSKAVAVRNMEIHHAMCVLLIAFDQLHHTMTYFILIGSMQLLINNNNNE